MSFAVFPNLLAEASAQSGGNPLHAALLVLGIFVAPIVLGYGIANALKLPDYGWKLAFILFTIVASASQIWLRWPPALGVDLKGGVILVYEIDEQESLSISDSQQSGLQSKSSSGAPKFTVNMGELATAIAKRINPTGLKETVVRPYGQKQIEIIVPGVDDAEIRRVKDMMENPGLLEFMIVVDNASKDGDIIQAARDQANDPSRSRQRIVRNDKGVQIGYWAVLDREQKANRNGIRPFQVTPTRANLIRNSTTGEIIDLTRVNTSLEEWVAENKLEDPQILMRVDEDYRVRGSDLSYARGGHDKNMSPDIEFGFGGDGIGRMSELTGRNLPDQSGSRQLGIVFDGKLISAPTIQGHISDQGQITGRFTQAQVDFYVALLKEGKLPAVLKKTPVSENQIGSLLGRDTIERGSYSLIGSVVVVLGFILVYYQFAGFVACLALVLNVALTVAIMIMLKAPFTMPGLAGLVLTVGMSVDANVLIYERMREEFAKGSGFRLALRNGFDRAMVTIIDSNLTTLLTGVVLYFIGTEQVKGFAITLVLGILTSMYTAIFFARVIFEVAERSGMIRSLSFFEFFKSPNINWVGYFKPAVVLSVIFIGIGLGATVLRGRTLFDIDLAGGTSVTMQLDKPIDDLELRKLIDNALENERDERNARVDYSVHPVQVQGAEKDTVYRLDTSIEDVERLKSLLAQHLGVGGGKGILKHYTLNVGEISSKAVNTGKAAVPPSADSTSSEKQLPEPPGKEPVSDDDTKAKAKAKTSEEPKSEEPKSEDAKPESPKKDDKGDDAEKSPAKDQSSATAQANRIQFVAFQEPDAATKKDDAATASEDKAKAENKDEAAKPEADAKPAAESSTEAAPARKSDTASEAAASEPTAPKPTVSQTITSVKLSFPGVRMTEEAIRDSFLKIAAEKYNEIPSVGAIPDGGSEPASDWTLDVQMDEEKTRAVVAAMKESFESSPIWQSSNKIGGQVAVDMQLKAVFAVLLSLVGIATYIWFRFHKLSWGIAAITSLAHDTFVMLGSIAISYWIADALKPLLVEEFKISLTVIAAFLTLIGFSINDTIVIFDRIREIRGKDPSLTAKMINDSLNQTLSRTVLTSGTVFATVVILYIFGGPGIHTFAFAMLVGVISGTYSTVFIAAPMLLWMLGKKDRDGFLSA